MSTDPFAAPGSDPTDRHRAPTAASRERGGCLTAFLGLMLITNPLTAFAYLTGGAATLPGQPGWAAPLLGIGCVLNTIAAVAIWNWKRWGLILFAATAIGALIVNLSIGLSPVVSFGGLAGPAILAALVHSRAGSFE